MTALAGLLGPFISGPFISKQFREHFEFTPSRVSRTRTYVLGLAMGLSSIALTLLTRRDQHLTTIAFSTGVFLTKHYVLKFVPFCKVVVRYHAARIAVRHTCRNGSAKEKRIAHENLEFVRRRYEELRTDFATVEMDVYQASLS